MLLALRRMGGQVSRGLFANSSCQWGLAWPLARAYIDSKFPLLWLWPAVHLYVAGFQRCQRTQFILLASCIPVVNETVKFYHQVMKYLWVVIKLRAMFLATREH